MKHRPLLTLAIAAHALLAGPSARADEGGVSFWLPGNFGSFAATPTGPGWSSPFVFYHSSGDEGSEELTTRGVRFAAGVDSHCDLLFICPTFVFQEPVAGAEASVSVSFAFGGVWVATEASFDTPGGVTIARGESDERGGITDLYPTATLKWGRGVHHTMLYTMAGAPIGTYDVDRLASMGANHWSLDGGGGYTWLDADKRLEASAVAGITYNWENPATDYKSGVSLHLDWAATRLFSEKFNAGVVGYVYEQITGDSGAGAALGEYQSQVSGIGPQANWSVDPWYVGLKAYWEFAAQNRPEGWNLWLTLEAPIFGAK
jgi:hypothetical protein